MKGDAGYLEQNASGANTTIVKWWGHAGGGECETSNGDEVSQRLKPEAAELDPECWQVCISGEWSKVLLLPFAQWSVSGQVSEFLESRNRGFQWR